MNSVLRKTIFWAAVLTVSLGFARADDLDKAFFVDRNSGDHFSVALTNTFEGKKRHSGLIRNGETLVFTGEVTAMTQGRDSVHFFLNDEAVYGYFGGSRVVQIPGISPAPGAKLETIEISNDTAKALGARSWKWRGLRILDAEGNRREVWVGDLGDLYYPPPGGGAVGGKLLEEHPALRFPFVSLEDFKSWFDEKPSIAAEAKSYYTIFATTPDAKHGLAFDWIQVRPEPVNYAAYSESRALGRAEALRSTLFFGSTPQWFLSTVYHEFQTQTDRPAFDEKLMAQIQKEDRSLGLDRLVYVWATDEHSRLPGGIRLFQGFASEEFRSKNLRLPVERQYPHLDIRGRFPGEALYEFNRLSVRKELAPWLGTKRLVNLLLEYMHARALPDGRFVLHTDRNGAVLYQRFFGAKVEFGPEETRDGTIVLSVERSALEKRVERDALPGLKRANLKRPLPWCAWTLK